MIRSELDTYAWNVICTIQDLIREERLTYEIDRPIDSTSADFPREIPKPISHQAFNRIIAAFVQHVYGQGLRLPRRVSDREALAEAIELLMRYYKTPYTEGYDGALVDTINGDHEAIESVLNQLAESIKAIERKKYIQGVFACQYQYLDWKTRLHIVTVYWQKKKDLFPELSNSDPAWLVENFRDLIETDLSSSDSVKSITSSERGLAPSEESLIRQVGEVFTSVANAHSEDTSI